MSKLSFPCANKVHLVVYTLSKTYNYGIKIYDVPRQKWSV